MNHKQGILFLLISVFLIAFFTSHATLSTDPPARYLEAKALVDRGSFQIEPIPHEPLPPGIIPGKNGELYSYFGKGQSVIFAAPYFVCSKIFRIGSDKHIRSVISLTVFPVFLALIAITLYGCLREFNFSPGQAYLAATLAVFATGLWQLSKEGQEGVHLAFFFILCAYGLRRYQNTASLKALSWSAAAMSCAFLTRSDTAPTFASFFFLAGYLILSGNQRNGKELNISTHRLKAMSLLCGILALAPAVHCTINMTLFGHPISGYDNMAHFAWSRLPTGLNGLLFSPGRSVFLYNPILLLVIPGLVIMWKQHRPWLLFIVIGFTGCLFLHAAYSVFHGNCCWGPRYLIRHIPLLFIPVTFCLAQFKLISPIRRTAVASLVLLSLAVQFAAVSLHHNRELLQLATAYDSDWSDREWTMVEPESRFLEIRLTNLKNSVSDMACDRIEPWPSDPDHLLTREKQLSAPALNYLAFWPYHLTYYLPSVKPQWAIPLWASSLILAGGIAFGLILMRKGWLVSNRKIYP